VGGVTVPMAAALTVDAALLAFKLVVRGAALFVPQAKLSENLRCLIYRSAPTPACCRHCPPHSRFGQLGGAALIECAYIPLPGCKLDDSGTDPNSRQDMATR
jgi:hypothetical protein